MPNNDYNGINKLYTFELESVEELMARISRQVRDRRFDRAADGIRLHVATAAALLREGINPPMTDVAFGMMY